MRRFTLLLSLLLMALLVACSGDDTAPAEAPTAEAPATEEPVAEAPASGEKVTIEFWHAMGGELGELVDELAARFNNSQDQIVVNATFQGMQIPIKGTYYVLGQRGLRTAWSMGGFMDMSVLMNLMQGGNINDVLVELLPYFSLFKHGLMPVFDVFPQDLVVDANDLDGDGDTTEMRPDWGGALPDVDMEPSHSQDIYLNVTPPANTPTHGGQPITSVVYVSGGLSSLGFTPLGLTSGTRTPLCPARREEVLGTRQPAPSSPGSARGESLPR